MAAPIRVGILHDMTDEVDDELPDSSLEARLRPAIDARGTIGDRLRARAGSSRSPARSTNGTCSSALLIDMQTPLMQHQTPRVVLIHQRDVVGRDDDRGARLVQLDEQPQ